MPKERFLTVLVPIEDGDCESTVYADLAALVAAVPVDMENTNKVYKLADGTYMRLGKNASTGQYEYREVVDREFPYLGKPLEIFDFTYDATRMGTAPTISAQNVMWFADRDDNGNDVTLEGMWTQKIHVSFNGENFYLKQIPTSSKSNDDARYKYDIDFVSERVILEWVYLYDIVSPFITEKPISESSEFGFYGDINELASRINASLIRSGLSRLTRKYVLYPNQSVVYVPYLTYEQWNQVGLNPWSLIGVVFSNQGEMSAFSNIYKQLGGDYNRYLMNYIYENVNGVYTLTGYQCKIGLDKDEHLTESEEKLITFENKTIHEALQEFHDTFGLQYYIARERDASGAFTANTIIWVADCEHDFADTEYRLLTSEPSDWSTDYTKYYKIVDGGYVNLTSAETFAADTYYKKSFVRDDDKVPTTLSPFDYGADSELMSKEKANTTDKIVTRITGVGSSENIPWHYPNPTPDGWVKPVYKIDGTEDDTVTVDYPTSEGSTVEESARYERYLKNRIGNTIAFGQEKEVLFATDYNPKISYTSNILYLDYYFPGAYYARTLTKPRLSFLLSYPYEAHCTYFKVELFKEAQNTLVDSYQSNQTYQDPTAFQTMCMNRNGYGHVALDRRTTYRMRVTFSVNPRPTVTDADYSGYYRAARDITYSEYTGNYDGDIDQHGYTHYYQGDYLTVHLGEDFYTHEVSPYINWLESTQQEGTIIYHTLTLLEAGYSADGATIMPPIARYEGKYYKNIENNTVYECSTSNQSNPYNGAFQYAFAASPNMKWEDWVSLFVNMRIRIHEAVGWYIGNKEIDLADYGLEDPQQNGSDYESDISDTIEFQRLKYVTPQSNLMPEIYIKTDGERRFYNAKNYYDKDASSLIVGTADTASGEVQVATKVRNPIYKEYEDDPDDSHYEFENEYIQVLPHEHIENFDDVKPTIKEQRNYVDVTDALTEEKFNANKTFFYTLDDGDYVQCTSGSVYDSDTDYYAQLRIDVVDTFGYDTHDSDEVWESNDHGSLQGEYKHPYFFARLRPLGFNIFDLALQDDMVLSMTTGRCGACNFKIGVDENTGKNPVQIWEYDVYGGDTYATRGTKLYSKGDLRRYVDTSHLYYDTDGTQDGYHLVDIGWDIISGGTAVSGYASAISVFESYVYTSEYIESGFVGVTKQEGKLHYEGDVMTSGRFIESQQDTTEGFVWVALMKDIDTYGTLMPSARLNYTDTRLNVYIRPQSVTDVHKSDSGFKDDENNADKFVLVNIRMPQVYLRRAERDLSRKLVAYMYDNNYQKFNFSIKFSRIFLAQNENVDDALNENSVLYVSFNNKTYRQYVKHYTYRMTSDAVLPEITVDMNEELNVTRTSIQQQAAMRVKDMKVVASQIGVAVQQSTTRMGRQMVSKSGNTILSGNIVGLGSGTSLVEMARASRKQNEAISEIDVRMETEYYKRKAFSVENGSDLNIGDEVFLPTMHKNGGVLSRRKWDASRGRFVTDTSEVFAPAFLDDTNKRLVDYQGGYELLASAPSDWSTNYADYYKIVNGVYTALTSAETFASNTYYRFVESTERNSVTPARVSGHQITYGSSGVLKPLYMSSNTISERNYEILTTQPSDWGSHSTTYYKKDSNGDFVPLTGSVTFAANTYYKETKTEYSVALTTEYDNIVKGIDQIDVALRCASITLTQNQQGGYDAYFVYQIHPARASVSTVPDSCSSETSDFWFRTVT